MFSEFHGQEFPGAVGQGFEKGDAVLELYEIKDINRAHDMITLVGYAFVIHALSFIVLQYKYLSSKRNNALMIKKND